MFVEVRNSDEEYLTIDSKLNIENSPSQNQFNLKPI